MTFALCKMPGVTPMSSKKILHASKAFLRDRHVLNRSARFRDTRQTAASLGTVFLVDTERCAHWPGLLADGSADGLSLRAAYWLVRLAEPAHKSYSGIEVTGVWNDVLAMT